MNKDRVAKWPKRIEDTFVGKGGLVGGDHLTDLIEYEKGMLRELIGKFHGYVHLMDAFFDFYIETHREALARQETKWSDKTIIFTLIHVATLWRFRASYIVFWNGYFVDANSLLRAVLENALNIAALQSRIISIREMAGDQKFEETKSHSLEEIYKSLRERVSKCDEKIRKNMIGKDSGLSSDAQKDLRLFVQGLHMSVHKAQINFISGYKKWVMDGESLPIFPPYDEELASIYLHSSVFLGWMIARTFPLLQIKDVEFPDRWLEKYKVLDESFADFVNALSKRMARSVEELIRKKFDFLGHKNMTKKER